MIDSDSITLLMSGIQLVNSLVLYPLFKFCFYLVKEINYIKGHLNLK